MSDDGVPGAMEDLSPATPPPGDGNNEPLTPAMSLVLHGSTALFTASVVVPIVLTAWALVTVAGIGLGGYALLHAGALEPSTLRTASAIGFVVGCVLAAGTVHLATARAPTAVGEESYPVAGTLLGLIVIAGLCTLAALPHSAFFPYPLTTIAVVAAATYLALGGLLASVRVTIAVVRAAQRSALGGRYRVGFLTATFLLLSAGAVLVLAGPAPDAALDAAADELELGKVHGPHGVLDAVPAALCLAAGEADPEDARDDEVAPACADLPNSTERWSDACIEQLMRDEYRKIVDQLDARFQCGADCDEIAADAAMATCARDDVENASAYFTTTAKNRALKWAKKRQQDPAYGCDDLDELPDDPCASAYNEDRAEALDRFKYRATCRMTAFERRVVWTRLEGLSHREVGERLSMTETKARNTFNNTMIRLRRVLRSWEHACRIRQ